jgi:beta-RFAP synthase
MGKTSACGPASARGLGAVRVEAPARLHLGFIDVSGSIGRRFGSLGLAIDDIATVVELRRASGISAEGPGATRALEYLRRLADDFDPPSGAALTVTRAIPEHVGLGSGTQLALAVGRAFGELFGIALPLRAIATRLDRGARSGIGIGVFETGGFVVDGGRAPGGDYPPIIARMPFPEAWRLLLVFDRAARGIHGDAERDAFRALKAFPQERAAHLAHLVMMRAMPGLVETDWRSFGTAIGELQRTVGDYFAAAQAGRFASPRVAEVLAWLESKDVPGVGQTSWGPTGFGLLESEVRAHQLMHEARARFAHVSELDFMVVQARNSGHRLESSGTALGGEAARTPPRASIGATQR